MNGLGEMRRWERWVWPLLGAALLVTAWHYAVLWTATKVFPAPFEVWRGLKDLAGKNVLWRDIAASLGRVGAGFGAAVAVGVPAGLWLGLSRGARATVNPVLQMLRPISPIAWIPVAIVLFGVGNEAAVFLIFLASFFPIVTACVSGVDTIPRVYRDAGRNFGLTQWQAVTKVIFPAALPQILMGLRLSLGVAWLVVVAAEMIAVDTGMGYLVIDARNSGKRYDLVVAAMLTIGLIGLLLDAGLRRVGRMKAVRWGFRDDT